MTLEQLPSEFFSRTLSSSPGIRQSTPNTLNRRSAISQGAQRIYEECVLGLVLASRHFAGN